jgi:TPR repeat protein
MADSIDALMKAAPSADTGKKILEWASDIDLRILSGDMMIGILSIEEVEKMPAALRRAAECGQQEAWLRLAKWHQRPGWGAPNLEQADEALRTALDQGVAGAGLALGRLRWFHRRDDATDAEKKQALETVADLAKKDDADGDASYLLGLMTCAGFGTAADPAAAFDIQRKAAKLGSMDASFELYVHLSTGLGVAVDEQAAFEHVQRAAEEGHPRAAYNMGAFLATGRHGKKDMAEAADWYQRACDLGNGRACATLAAMYATAEGVAKDRDRARGLFDVAAELGFDPSAIKDAIDWDDEG